MRYHDTAKPNHLLSVHPRANTVISQKILNGQYWGLLTVQSSGTKSLPIAQVAPVYPGWHLQVSGDEQYPPFRQCIRQVTAWKQIRKYI